VRFVRYAAAAVLVAFTRCSGVQAAKTGVTPAPTAPQVVIWEYKFKPQALTVSVGTPVNWVNRDMTPHTATHRSFSDEPFDSGNMTANAEFLHTFKTPGTYSYLCVLHQGMTGTIVVQ